jgi:hypothetical protein
MGSRSFLAGEPGLWHRRILPCHGQLCVGEAEGRAVLFFDGIYRTKNAGRSRCRAESLSPPPPPASGACAATHANLAMVYRHPTKEKGLRSTTMNRLFAVLIWIYAACCVLVLILVPPTREDWFGILRHPHGGVPGLLLALPWSFAMRWLHYHGTAYTTALVVFAMAMNVFLLVSLYRRFNSSADALLQE